MRLLGRVVALTPQPDGGFEALLEDGQRVRVAPSAPSAEGASPTVPETAPTATPHPEPGGP